MGLAIAQIEAEFLRIGRSEPFPVRKHIKLVSYSCPCPWCLAEHCCRRR